MTRRSFTDRQSRFWLVPVLSPSPFTPASPTRPALPRCRDPRCCHPPRKESEAPLGIATRWDIVAITRPSSPTRPSSTRHRQATGLSSAER